MNNDIPPAWEYETLTFVTHHEVWYAFPPHDTDHPKQAERPLKTLLNELGKQGWEVVTHLGNNDYLLKRPIPLDRRPIFTEEL